MEWLIDNCNDRSKDQRDIELQKGQDLTYVIIFQNLSQVHKIVNIYLKGQNSYAQVIGLFWGKDDESNQISINLNHQSPNTSGKVFVKGVLTDQASCDFYGMIKIAQNAQNTNSFLEEKTLLISHNARAKSVPSLEIEANEVKASHASTVSHIDEDQSFYLQSRGFTKDQAKKEIVKGFYEEVFCKIPNIKTRSELQKAWTKVIKL